MSAIVDCAGRDFAAFLSGPALNSLRRSISPRAWFLAHSWGELDTYLDAFRVKLALVDPAAGGKIDLTAVTAIIRRHSNVPIVAHVPITPEHLLAVAHLSKHGLFDVLVEGLGDDYHRLSAMIERVHTQHLADEILARLSGRLEKLGPRLKGTAESILDQPNRFGKVADIARQSGVSTQHLHRAFHAAELGTPKKLLVAAKLAYTYALLRACVDPVREISVRVGYSDARILEAKCVTVFGCSARTLRFEHRTSVIVLSLLEWLCKSPQKAPRVPPQTIRSASMQGAQSVAGLI
jgi:AraC-like DNA-binding protein